MASLINLLLFGVEHGQKQRISDSRHATFGRLPEIKPKIWPISGRPVVGVRLSHFELCFGREKSDIILGLFLFVSSVGARYGRLKMEELEMLVCGVV